MTCIRSSSTSTSTTRGPTGRASSFAGTAPWSRTPAPVRLVKHLLDPCIDLKEQILGDDLHLRVLSTQASIWDFVVAQGSVDLAASHIWVGLKNSDDQGTNFDIQVELLKNGTPIASGIQRCVTGVTRNASLAKEVVFPWDASPTESVASGDVLALRVSTRIGTNPNGTKCGPSGHNNAVGLRLYYDASSRASRFGATISPDPSVDLYLHSNGNACGNAESTGVTTRTLTSTAPTGASTKCKDSTSVNFAGGNPFRVIGIWSRAPLL